MAPAQLSECLHTLEQLIPGPPWELIVVDNGSSDETVTLARGRSDCRVVVASNGGYSSGINIGVRETPDADAWVVLNPDLTCAPKSIARMALALVHPGVGIVGPRVLSPSGQLQPSMRREPTLLRNTGLGFTGLSVFSEYVSDESAYVTDQTADWLLGAALMFSKQCLDAVGAWDESFFLYSEETDFCLKARDRGFASQYVGDAVVTHWGGGSGQSDAMHAMQILNRVRLYTRSHSLPAAFAYYLLTVCSEVSWWLRGASKSRAALPALIRPSRRPPELGCGSRLLPR